METNFFYVLRKPKFLIKTILFYESLFKQQLKNKEQECNLFKFSNLLIDVENILSEFHRKTYTIIIIVYRVSHFTG